MTRAELETRRIMAIPDLDAEEMSPSELARKYEVSRTTIYRWYDARQSGSTLKLRKAPGRPRHWTAKHAQMAQGVYRDGPRKVLGVDSDRWTQERFTEALAKELQLELSPDHVGRLMHQWGLR